MSKQMAFYILLAGAAINAWDGMSNGSLYGVGKPLNSMQWKLGTAADAMTIRIGDAAVIAGALFYFI
jgi:hypothetical protein